MTTIPKCNFNDINKKLKNLFRSINSRSVLLYRGQMLRRHLIAVKLYGTKVMLIIRGIFDVNKLKELEKILEAFRV